jgi:hypothetical protein
VPDPHLLKEAKAWQIQSHPMFQPLPRTGIGNRGAILGLLLFRIRSPAINNPLEAGKKFDTSQEVKAGHPQYKITVLLMQEIEKVHHMCPDLQKQNGHANGR